MWTGDWREEVWRELDQPWDLVIVGGGITGAGILREAARLGLRALLVEQKDFAWGTSSRSSKLVHGGLRYLKEGKIGLTRASVLERQQLLAEGPGLIDPLGFLLATYKSDKTGRLVFRAGLTVYDLLALQWSHKYYSPRDFQMLAPHLTSAGLKGGFRYGDAQTDDARLVLRVIAEAVADGGVAINYVAAEAVLRDENGRVTGLTLGDALTGQTADVTARVVVSATGAWADTLREQVGGAAKIRPLRGSHLVFPNWRLPVAQAISFLHPIDQRPVMIFPWEGVTLVGTTDVDHHNSLDKEPCISPDETAYLLAAVEAQFPSLGIGLGDVVAAFAGVRPVIGSGKEDPSEESRDHVVWVENGLLTVTGGKLTTFRLIALDALKEVRHLLPDLPQADNNLPVLNPVDVALPGGEQLAEEVRRRLLGRYGAAAPELAAAAQPGELEVIPGTQTVWAELRWAARAEAVVHLDDLLLRRVRLGILLPAGGAALLPRIQAICQAELGWDDGRWQSEQAAYLALVRGCYNIPDAALVPDWRALLAAAKQAELADVADETDGGWQRPLLLATAVGLVVVGWYLFTRRMARG
ncbi:MAG: glycerol-3-phosphate dehydrogenase/oxidase [Chloroflexi bacterium]|nr:glycerol-3-phosphate dehydrogenase/oxidase [Chloroflexota bacterium]